MIKKGLVRIDFDGTSFGAPQFFTDVYNASYIADNFWIHDYHKNWLMLSYTAIENSDGGIITDLYDISSGMNWENISTYKQFQDL